MRRLGRRASVLVAFSLLVSAATAYAECAWVVWVRGTITGMYPTAVQLNQSWVPRGAWPTRSECESNKALRVTQSEQLPTPEESGGCVGLRRVGPYSQESRRSQRGLNIQASPIS
jgi:hypothetical protein